MRDFLHEERLRRVAAPLGFHLSRRPALTGFVQLHLRELICHRNRLLSGTAAPRRRAFGGSRLQQAAAMLLLLLLRLVLPVAELGRSTGGCLAS